MLRCFIWFLAFSLLNACSTSEQKVQQLMQLSSKKDWLNSQTMVNCTVQTTNMGNTTVIAPYAGLVNAGIDLSLLTPASFEINGKKIKMIVPSATINAIYSDFIQSTDDGNAEVKNQKNRSNQPEEIVQIIRENIDSVTILQQTEQKAAIMLQQLLKNYGYTSISIRFTENKLQKNPQ
jgi:hypothetical protein